MQIRRVPTLWDHQINCLRAGVFDVGPGGVEVGVVRHDHTRTAEHTKQNFLSCSALVRGDHMAKRKQVGDRLAKYVKRGRTRIRLIAVLNRRPLVAAHRASARVGEQVDHHIARRNRKQVEPGRAQSSLTLQLGGEM